MSHCIVYANSVRFLLPSCVTSFCWHGKCHISILVHTFRIPVLLNYHIDIYNYLGSFSIIEFIFLQIEYFFKMAEIKQERQFKCEDCEKLFTRKTTQRDHQARMHKNELRYFCFVCKKGFTTREEWGSTWLCTMTQYKTGRNLFQLYVWISIILSL